MAGNLNITPDEIGFDFDGVVADIGEAFIRMACDKYNYCSFTLKDITSFQVEDCIPIPRTIIENIFSDILVDSLAAGLKPLSDAVAVLSDMTLQGKVTIITARSLEKPVHDWLNTFFPSQVISRITLVAMGDHDKKVRYVQEHNLQYFVDDRLETCLQMADANITPLLFSQPWNRTTANLQIVSNWNEIRSIINLDTTQSDRNKRKLP